jgi:hypothetical protein
VLKDLQVHRLPNLHKISKNMQIRQIFGLKILYCCKLLIEANAVVWTAKLTKLREKGSSFSSANYPLIICTLG